MTNSDTNKMYATNNSIADACMAKRAMLIDCDKCYWQTLCDQRLATRMKVETEITDDELIQRMLE